MVLRLAWRLFRHEAQRGELSIILAAIVLSVASVLSLSLFSEKLQEALTQRTADFIAADRVLDSDKPVDAAWIADAQSRGIETAHQIYARSMVFFEDSFKLVSLRAAGEGYPLKGEVKLAEVPFGVGQVTDTLPGPGEAWVESRLFQELGINKGDNIEIGDGIFQVTQVLSEVPDSGFSLFNTNPKVLISLAEIDNTAILGPGSRATYSYFFAGDGGALDDFYEWLEPQLDSELHYWMSVEDDDSPIGRSVARAEQYFLLASLLAIVLAAVAIAVAAQRYSQRHYDPVAIFKTLGASQQTVQRVYLLQVVLIALLGIFLGTLIGLGIQQLVTEGVAGSVGVSLDTWHWRPFFIAVFTGLVCALLFSLYPLLKLFGIPPLRVLRKDIESSVQSRVIQFAAAGSAILLLMWAYSGNVKLSLILFAAGVVLVGLLMVATLGLIGLGRKFGSGKMGAWQLAWARIKRRAMDNSVQLISFAVTIMLLLVVLVMRNDMVKQWRDQLPEGTPNYFMSNITQAQQPAMAEHFAAQGIGLDEFFPVVRGRFVAVNDETLSTSVGKEDPEEDRRDERRGLGREANLTWGLTLQNENKIVEGEWLTAHRAGDEYGVSVEQGIAQRMNIKLGDELTFNIGSIETKVRVTSIREVNWQTMQPNFFFVLQPAALQDFPPTYITSFHLPQERKSDIAPLMRPFASITLFDVDARINQLRSIIDQVSMAVEFILVLVLVAGSLVLVAQVQASMDERQQELAILRTLGAKGKLIRASVVLEFIIIGLVAGFMAALANEFALYLLQSQVFQMEGSIHWQYWLIAPLVGAAVVGALGLASCWRLLSLNTAHMLRQIL